MTAIRMTGSFIRGMLLAGLASTLAACTGVAPDPYLTTQAIEPEAPQSTSDVSAEFAAAYLPSLAGGIQSVRQTVANYSLHQEIVYSNQTLLPGENILTVDVAPPESSKFLRPPSESKIWREMRAALPAGMRAAISPTIGQNASGVYGFATASSGTGSCIYAWQLVKQVNPSDSINTVKLTRRNLAASIRLRYCNPNISADRIKLVMDGLKLKAMNSQTIDMLRFAASSGDVAQPVAAAVAPEPVVVRKRKVVRHAAVETTTTDDWRLPQRESSVKASDEASPPIDQAVAIPLPDSGAAASVTLPAADDTAAVETRKIDNAAEIPLPE